MATLHEFLVARGYVRVELRRSLVGHFHAEGSLNGRRVEVLVDTGAATTVVSLAVVEEIGLRTEYVDANAGGAGGALDQYRVHGAVLQFGELTVRMRGPAGIDFAHINASLRANESTEVDMILGVDVFDAHAAVIEYATHSLYLRMEPAE